MRNLSLLLLLASVGSAAEMSPQVNFILKRIP